MSDLADAPKPAQPDARLNRLWQPAAWLLAWRRRRLSSPAWTVVAALLAAVLALPLATIVVLSLGSPENAWPHLTATVLPGAIADTLALLAGVSLATLVFGVSTAWLVTMCR